MRRAICAAAVPLGGYAIAQVLGRRAGATRAERREPLPVRARGRTAPLLLTAAYLAAIPPADLIMAMGMLHGLRKRVQRQRTTPPQAPDSGGGERSER